MRFKHFAPLLLVLLALPACDTTEDDVRTIGGTFAVDDTPFGRYSVTIPVGTESDPDTTFTGTQTEDAGTFTYTGTYDHPSLRLDFGIDADGQPDVVPCTVAEDTGSMECTVRGTRYTLTRQ